MNILRHCLSGDKIKRSLELVTRLSARGSCCLESFVWARFTHGSRVLRATSHTRLRARDRCTFKHSRWWKWRSRSKFTSRHAWGTNGVSGCKMDVKSTWIRSYMASNGSCVMVTWVVFKIHLLEVGLIQNWGDYGIPNVHNCWFILFYHVWGFAWIEMAFGWGPCHIWLHITLEDPWPHYMILEVSWDNLWKLSFGLS